MAQTTINKTPAALFAGMLSEQSFKRVVSRIASADGNAGLIMAGNQDECAVPTSAAEVSRGLQGLAVYQPMREASTPRILDGDPVSLLTDGSGVAVLLSGAAPTAEDPVYAYRGATTADRGKVTQDSSATDVTRVPGALFTGRTASGLAEITMRKVPSDTDASFGSVGVDLGSFVLAAGTPLAAFADGASATPGIALTDSEAKNIRWNNHATPAAIYASIPLPPDLDDESPAYLEALVSKTGATLGDATTLAIGAFFIAEGNLHDADANAGGTTPALVGNATAKTTDLLSVTLAAADIPSGALLLNVSIQPTAGTLGTDDLCLHMVRLRYRRK